QILTGCRAHSLDKFIQAFARCTHVSENLPRTTSPAASAHASTESTKTSAAGEASGTSTKPASPTSAHAPPSAPGAEPPETRATSPAGHRAYCSAKNEEHNEDDQQRQPPGPACVHRLRSRLYLSRVIEGNASIRRDDGSEPAHPKCDGAAIIAGPEQRNHLPADVTCFCVIYDWLKTVPDFDPVFPFLRSQQQQDAAIVFITDTEVLEEIYGVSLLGFAFQRMHGDDCDLRFRLAFDLSTQGFQASPGRSINYSGKVGNVSGRMDIRDFFAIGTYW